MKNAFLIISITLFSVLFGSDPVFGFRCDGKIVSIGNTKFEVISQCGEPDYKDFWIENRVKRDLYRELFPKLEHDNYREPLLVEEYVVIEEWTYNLGSNRFIRYLKFKNGKLVNITSGTYGY